MRAALAVLNRLVADGVLAQYAIGGAMAEMFYAEPVVTYDLDVFVVLPRSGSLLTLAPLYGALAALGHPPQAELVMIEGIPVQFLPAPTALVEEALAGAQEIDVQGEPARVFRVEHLIAIAVQTGRPKDRERVARLLGQAAINRSLLEDICRRHQLPIP
jgi:hypothetical protein